MKKILLVSALVLVFALTLTALVACDGFFSALDDINKLIKLDYSTVTLNVTTETGEFTLNGVYTLTFDGDKTIVDYSFDRFNDLSIDGNNSDSYLTTVSGRAVVQNGKIVEGDVSVDLPQELDFNGISFNQAFFTNTNVTGAKFEADVKDVKGFTGNADMSCSNMHVTVLYSKDALSKITITYLSEGGSNVSISYLFTK